MYRSLLITGGAGFIGSNFVHYWTKKYPTDRVVVLDSLSYASNLDSINNLLNSSKINFVKGNINDKALILKILKNFKISHLINFAAETHVDRSIKAPDIFINSNILGTYNLLKCFEEHWDSNKKPIDWRFLQISTDEVFGTLDSENEEKFNEKSSYSPRSPYSASKASSDHLVQSWNATYGLPTLITNCSNNYGPYQFPEKLIPLAVTNILLNKEIPIYGDGLNIRDWLFVEDHCEAIDLVINKGIIGEKYCVGANNEYRNIDLIKKICLLVDTYSSKYNLRLKNEKSSDLIKFVPDRKGHDRRYAIDSSKIESELNWKPKVNLENGLNKTINWYLKNKTWWENLIHR